MLIPVYQNEFWGFASTDTGNIKVDCIYDKAYIFKQGLCAVSEGAHLKYVNQDGEVALNTEYSFTTSLRDKKSHCFSEGRAGVVKDGKWGFIDTKGDTVVEPRFELVLPYSDGRAVVRHEGKYGVIDLNGTQIVEPKFAYISPYSEGFAAVTDSASKIGYIDLDGNVVIEPQFLIVNQYIKHAGDFSGGVAAARDSVTGLVGFIDKAGSFKIPPQFAEASKMTDGFSRVQDKGVYSDSGIINLKGELTVPFEYRDLMKISEQAFSCTKDDKKGLVSVNGTILIPFEYDKLGTLKEGLISAQKEGSYGYLDSKGNIVIDFTFNRAGAFKDGFAKVSTEQGDGVIDSDGQVVIPCTFENINPW